MAKFAPGFIHQNPSDMAGQQAKTIDEYIAQSSEDVQKHLEEIRACIQKAAPEAVEAIKYAIPTFVFRGNLIHFAAHKNHIGLYPTPSGMAAFETELLKYRSGKGSAQFPLDGPMPFGLIEKIVAFRIGEVMAKKKK